MAARANMNGSLFREAVLDEDPRSAESEANSQ
jgi:hypothetical protein